MIVGVLVTLLMAGAFAYAQQESANDIVLKMQHDLNLSSDQVAGITQVVERYVDASSELQKSIDDGTINPSAIDSQKQQLKAQEDQGIAQFLRPDQLYEYNQIQAQENQHGNADGATGDDADQYSNMPAQQGS